MSSAHFQWRKLSSAKWEDVWTERLGEFSDRLAITSLAGSKSIRVEIFQITRPQADRLTKTFGGQVLKARTSLELDTVPPRPPIKVRDKLVIVATEAERDAFAAVGRAALFIPAGMAFGTGDHATTSTCLRLLADVGDSLAGSRWEALDLGCGSGILALAARKLGASRAVAGDFDPDSVRTAKENAAANRITNVTIRKLDVRGWQPDRMWPVVIANMYSGILVEIAPKIARAVERGGHVIFSGILREQETEVVAAFARAKLRIERVIRRGKWVTGIARR